MGSRRTSGRVEVNADPLELKVIAALVPVDQKDASGSIFTISAHGRSPQYLQTLLVDTMFVADDLPELGT